MRVKERHFSAGVSESDAKLTSSVGDQPYQQVTVRRLPDGAVFSASLEGLSGHLLRIQLLPDRGTPDFGTGDLVEVNCPTTLYLGEVSEREGETLVVGVEHALDRAALKMIQQVWYVPAGD